MTDTATVALGDVIDSVKQSSYRNPMLILEVGKSYINNTGHLVILTAKKVRPSSWMDKRFPVYYLDEKGQRYFPNGEALKGKQGSQPPRYLRSLADKALGVKVGQSYDYHWPDGRSVGHYTVTAVDAKGYDIIWSNGVPFRINYGCPLNYDSKLVVKH